MIIDKELLNYYHNGYLWADMRRETNSVITKQMNYYVVI